MSLLVTTQTVEALPVSEEENQPVKLISFLVRSESQSLQKGMEGKGVRKQNDGASGGEQTLD
jgi:hypothetical protein